MINRATTTASRPSLLVDYSKNSSPRIASRGLSLRGAAQSRRRQPLPLTRLDLSLSSSERSASSREEDPEEIPQWIFVQDKSPSSSCHDASNSKNTPVTFQLRKNLVDRDNFLSFLKGHFSESDLDLEPHDLTVPPQKKAQQDKAEEEPLTSNTCHTIGSVSVASRRETRNRRDNLKKTFRKAQSMRQLNLDTSPLSLKDSNHEQPRARALPLRNKTFHGTTTTTSMVPVQATVTSAPLKTKRANSRGRRAVRRVRTADSPGALSRRMALDMTRGKEPQVQLLNSTYLPQTLQASSHNPGRRTMMARQGSFITGSRIRTLRA
ncbi:expressed unknown protein [Seminavis robusta]|uniref:Uncharacterized protein n=1 Tax=Seminavis robusta TaxID=568900 RepID=A0A9N8D4E5_9STRA|nr:expressed unknown protein [Seminavis robusta]|eukprot:Sro3_g002070.1 n/a (322) ;mRNA; f:41499-42464